MFMNGKDEGQYKKHAEYAASLENSGQLNQAAFAWTVASQHARQPDNTHWAQARSDFCSAWAKRYEGAKAA